MADIVTVVTTSHVLMSSKGAEASAKRAFEGMLEIGRHVTRACPDVIILISDDHMFNVKLGETAPFLLGANEVFEPFGEMDIPRDPFPGHPSFANELASYCQQHEVDTKLIRGLRPDHGTAIPLLFVNPQQRTPVLPVYVNYARAPVPTPRECWEFGRVLNTFIRETRPASERVAVVGTGGLSHWIGYDGLNTNEDFDRAFLAAVAAGEIESWAAKTSEAIREAAGNGGLEVMNWLIAAACARPTDRAGRIVYYEPLPSWFTGMGGVIFQ